MRTSFLSVLCLSLLLSACGSPDTVKVEDDTILEVQKYNQVMKTGEELIDPVHGKQARFAYGALSGTNGISANGVAYLHTFEDGNSTLTVNLNILVAPKGNYTVQLKNAANAQVMNVGTLASILGDARHSMQFTTNLDVSAYNQVLVYLGTKLVAEGTMKVAPK